MGMGADITVPADQEGDLAGLFEHFASKLGTALVKLHERLQAVQDREERLPWLMVRPPDELDRQIFEAIDRLGSARTRDLLESLSDPPPMRTLQRRLQQLCRDGLVVKHGARKFAFYRVAGQE